MSPRACRAGATESDCLGGRWDAETRPSQRASRVPAAAAPALPPSNPGSQSTQDAYRSTARAEVNNIVVVTPVSRSARHRGESTVSGQTPGESFLKRVSHGSILSGVRRAAGRDVPGGGTAHVLAPPELSEEARVSKPTVADPFLTPAADRDRKWQRARPSLPLSPRLFSLAPGKLSTASPRQPTTSQRAAPAMKLSPLLLLAPGARACMDFNGTFPFSAALPFEASIVDNGVRTCWIATSYAEHAARQQSPSSARRRARSAGRRIALTGRPAAPAAPASLASPFAGPKHAAAAEEHVDLGVRPPRRASLPSETYGERGREEARAWAPWPFECVAGHRARANVGLRTFVYAAHGQEFSFVPKMEEDIWGERWVYSLRLWCKGKDKNGNTAVEKPAAAAKAEDGAASRTGGGAAAASGKGASGQRASGQPASAQDANIRAAVPKNQESIQGASGQGLNAQSGSTKKSGV
ncbi:hypothetical protein JHW43_009319 [Diplocarpon mali]|nr:hypothetical protein JHW43_009319 [Diplocarpon mali]